jgi:hypothetical protein
MAGTALRKSLQKVGRTQLQEFVQSIARALGPRGRLGELQGGSEGGLIGDSDLRRERVERSASASSSSAGGHQLDRSSDQDGSGLNGYISRREAARARRMRKQVQYMESVLHVTGTTVFADSPDGERRRSSQIVLLDPALEVEVAKQSSAGTLVVIDRDPEFLSAVKKKGEQAAKRTVVPLETSRAGVSDSILKGHFHLPPPWGAGTARPLNRKKFSSAACREYSQVATQRRADATLVSHTQLLQDSIVVAPSLDHTSPSLVQLRGLAAKAKRDKKKKGGKAPKVAWDQDEETGEAIEVGGSGGSDVERAEPDFDVEERMEAALSALQKEFSKLRTGRASPGKLFALADL